MFELILQSTKNRNRILIIENSLSNMSLNEILENIDKKTTKRTSRKGPWEDGKDHEFRECPVGGRKGCCQAL